MSAARKFLTARWRYLAMLNYEVDPAILRPLVPRGTELDSWQDRVFVSVVGFLFEKTRLLGIPVPFYQSFEEVNLRFYVRRRAREGWRRGVVFVKELVPRWAVATLARLAYNENYVSLPMRHQISDMSPGGLESVAYDWQFAGRWHGLKVTISGSAREAPVGSEAAFITEHYWGYARQRDGDTVEYQVEHPPWGVWQGIESHFDCDVAALYGPEFVEPTRGRPSSVFVADGSAVTVRQGIRI